MKPSTGALLTALVITLTQFPLGREAIAAQTLEQIKQDCEELEAYWQRDPPSGGGPFAFQTKPARAVTPRNPTGTLLDSNRICMSGGISWNAD